MDVGTGALITAVVAAIYGIGFAVAPAIYKERWSGMQQRYTMVGAGIVAVCGVLFVVLLPALSG